MEETLSTEQCAICGARLPDGRTCQELHDAFLNFEAFNGVPHRIHFLMVTSFIVQHERYSDEALNWARAMLQAHLDEQVTDQQLLYQLTKGMKSNTRRTWKFTRAVDAPPLPKVAWRMTIADVAQNMHDVESYSKQVKQWAHSTLEQMATYFEGV